MRKQVAGPEGGKKGVVHFSFYLDCALASNEGNNLTRLTTIMLLALLGITHPLAQYKISLGLIMDVCWWSAAICEDCGISRPSDVSNIPASWALTDFMRFDGVMIRVYLTQPFRSTITKSKSFWRAKSSYRNLNSLFCTSAKDKQGPPFGADRWDYPRCGR